MTSLQIRYFLKVADCMSFSRAAEEMFVAQPSVSRQIQQLEKELGYTLFDRTERRAVSLTEAGMVFRDCFLRFETNYEEAQNTARALRGEKPLSLRVGVGKYWDMTESLSCFREEVLLRYPKAHLEFYNLPFLQLRSQLDTGRLDVVFCTGTSQEIFADLEILELTRLESRAYVRRGLLAPAQSALQVEDFEGQTLLTLPQGEAPMAVAISQMQFYTHRVKVYPKEIPDRDTIYQALLMGDGFAVFDELMWMSMDARLVWLPLEESVPLSMIWRKKDQNPLIHLLAETMIHEMNQDENQTRYL